MKKILIVYMILVVIVLALGIRAITADAAQPVALQELAEPIKATPPAPELPQEEPEVETKKYRYIEGCPLSLELQQGIFDICESRSVSFEFVMSVIAQESSFNADASGDNCQSAGLMQIQEKWHSELMAELGVSDLYDPLQNVEVGVALLQSYFEESNDVYFVLMKYNGGHKYAKDMLKAGKVSKYALEITERAMLYEEQNGI